MRRKTKLKDETAPEIDSVDQAEQDAMGEEVEAVGVPAPLVVAEAAPVPVIEIPVVKVTKYRVASERAYVEGGFRHILRAGAVVDDASRDIAALRKQGVHLEELAE